MSGKKTIMVGFDLLTIAALLYGYGLFGLPTVPYIGGFTILVLWVVASLAVFSSISYKSNRLTEKLEVPMGALVWHVISDIAIAFLTFASGHEVLSTVWIVIFLFTYSSYIVTKEKP